MMNPYYFYNKTKGKQVSTCTDALLPVHQDSSVAAKRGQSLNLGAGVVLMSFLWETVGL